MPPQTSQGNLTVLVVQLVMIVGIIYFVLLRPQRQEQKKHQQMLAKLAKNDEVVTSAGIHGTVVNVKDTTVVVRVDENVKIEFDKACIVSVKKQQSASEGK
jgi:preprotein translocase subunit YajC